MNSKHKTKEAIEKCALNLLNKGSLQGFGVNKLLQECNITKGSFYCHFPEGKNQVIKEVLTNLHEYGLNLLEPFYEHGKSLGGILYNIFDNYANTLEKNKFLACTPILRIAVDASKEEKEIQYICQSILDDRLYFHEKKLLQCGFAKSDAKQKAQFIVSAIEGGVLLSRAHKSKEPLLETGVVLKECFNDRIYILKEGK